MEIDARMRDRLVYAKEPYLTPPDALGLGGRALDEVALGAEGQRDGFGNECEGHCGM